MDASDRGRKIVDELQKFPDFDYGSLDKDLIVATLKNLKVETVNKKVVMGTRTLASKLKSVAVSGVVYFCYIFLCLASTDHCDSTPFYKDIFIERGQRDECRAAGRT